MAKTILSRLREGKQREWAARLGLSQAYVSQLAGGRREPSLGVLVAIADTLGVSDRELGASAREMVMRAPAPSDCDPTDGEPVVADGEDGEDVPAMVSAFGAIFGMRARRK